MQSVETMFENIASSLKIIFASEKAEREQREEDERQRQRQRAELARRRDLARKRKEREEKRIPHLRELVQLQREATGIKSWLASLPAIAAVDAAKDFGCTIQWAQRAWLIWKLGRRSMPPPPSWKGRPCFQ